MRDNHPIDESSEDGFNYLAYEEDNYTQAAEKRTALNSCLNPEKHFILEMQLMENAERVCELHNYPLIL